MSEAIVRGHWNIPWLRDLPTNWQVASSKRLFSVRKELARPEDQQLAATQAFGVINQKEFERRVGRRVVQIMQNLEKRRHVERDDFVISMRSFEGGIERAWDTGCIRSSYIVLKPSAEVDVGFFQYLFKSHDYIQALRATSNFIRDGQDLNVSNFSLVDLPVPPFDEQRLIARLLDWHSGQTAKLIGAKKKIIALLNEQKQAIIHRAVTRGLDPNAKLKPSGIPWLGDVPEGWDILPLKRIASFKSGAGFPVGEQGGKDQEIPFLKVSDMTLSGNERYVESWNNSISRETATALSAYIFPSDTIIFPKVGGAMLTNKRRILKQESCIDNNVMGCVVRSGNLEFIYLKLQQIDLGKISKPGPVPAIGEGEVGEIRVAHPPVEEQCKIVEWLGIETRTLDRSTSIVASEIALIQEFRTRLIADVVTGKLDIRAAAARLPEITEIDRPDSFGDDLSDGDDLDESSENEEVAA